MNKGNSDSFVNACSVRGENPFGVEHSGNFFLDGEVNIFPPEPSRRLNDYDSNLLEQDAYKEVSDELFKIEYKIAKIEEELKEIDIRIQSARDIYNYDQIDILSGRKQQLKEERETLLKMYNEMSIPAKISEGILNMFGERFRNRLECFGKAVNSISEVLVSKLPKKLSSVVELKKSLSRLESINKNVDELIGLNIPYGENHDKYEQLSKYIIRANSIQNNISKMIK